MGKRTSRNDLLVTCPECRRRMRPCNLERHVTSHHPDTSTLRSIHADHVAEMVREACRA